MEALIPLLSGIKDTATLVLALMLIGLSWLHITTIRENRQDRKELMDLLGKTTEAINKVGNILSAMTGKPL